MSLATENTKGAERRSVFLPALALSLVLIANNIYAFDFESEHRYKVTRVTSGDVVEIKKIGERSQQCRLANIDAPEKGQDYYKRSRQYLRKTILRKSVEAIIVDVEKEHPDKTTYICSIYYGGFDINLEMIEKGYAWAAIKQDTESPRYFQAEDWARDNKLGIWERAGGIEPWIFKAQQREVKKKK